MHIERGNTTDAWGFPLAQRHFGLSSHRVADRGSHHSPGLFFDVERLGSQRPDHDSVGDAPLVDRTGRAAAPAPQPSRTTAGKARLEEPSLWDQRDEFEDQVFTGVMVDPRTGEALAMYERAAPDADNPYTFSNDGRNRKYAQLQGPFRQVFYEPKEITTEEFHGPSELREDISDVRSFVRHEQMKRARISAFHGSHDDESAWYDESGNSHIEDVGPTPHWPVPRHPAMPALHVPGGKTQQRVSSRAMHIEGGDSLRGPKEAPPQRRDVLNHRLGIADTRAEAAPVHRPDAVERQGRFESTIPRRQATIETREEAPPLVRPSAAETLSRYAEVMHRRTQLIEAATDALAVRPEEVPTLRREEARPQRVRASREILEAGPGRDFVPEPSAAARRDDVRRPHRRGVVDREPASAMMLYHQGDIEVGAAGMASFRNEPARMRPRIGALADLMEGGAAAPRATGETPVLVDEGLFTRRRFHSQMQGDAVAFAGDASERSGRYHEVRSRALAPDTLQDSAGRGPTGEIAHSAFDNRVNSLNFHARPSTPGRFLRTEAVLRNEHASRASVSVDSNYDQ